MKLVADIFLLYVINKHQFNLFTVCSFFNNLFTITGSNSTMCSKNRIGNKIFVPNFPLLFFK